MIAFVQRFGVYSPDSGGSAKIFRSLLDIDHPRVLSINTQPAAAPPPPGKLEIRVPSRPDFGRLERSRLARGLGLFDWLYSGGFARSLRRSLREHEIGVIHLFLNDYSIVPVYRIAKELRIPLFLSVHDDIEYLFSNLPLSPRITACAGKAWREANGIFVISDELGREFSRRYGAREYAVVTDGLKTVAPAPLPRPAKSLRLYFMGLFHNTYAQNLRAVLDALKIVRSRHPDWEIGVTCRCGGIPVALGRDDVPVKVLPFAGEAEVQNDMLSADLLYQPMPFQQEARAFSQFSLSTKMITYLGSGLPIFYHGRDDSAACNLLRQYDAASLCTTLDPDEIAERLLHAVANRDAIVANALTLARSRFMLADQQRKFWQPILAAL
jgi:hypothetical protein